MTTALENNREDAALGAAWRRCEAALPEDTSLELHHRSGEGFLALSQAVDVSQWAETPTAALEALAEKLESL